jgi:hypothetical protein
MNEYVKLQEIFNDALAQAASGKGKERHAVEGEAFENQPILEITRRIGLGYPLGQAIKKIYESERLEKDAAIKELLGAINYIAAAVIRLKELGLGPGAGWRPVLDQQTTDEVEWVTEPEAM